MGIVDWLKMEAVPILWIVDRLREGGVRPPPADIFHRGNGDTPAGVIDGIGTLVAGTGCFPMRRGFSRPIFSEVLDQPVTIDLQSISGVTQTTCQVKDFEDMQHADGVLAKIKEHGGNVEAIARKTLEGDGDCVAMKGEFVHVVKTGWDGKMWVSNEGGAHKLAAVWLLDRKAGRSRPLQCKLTVKHISSEAVQHANTIACWLFSLAHPKSVTDIDWPLCEQARIEFMGIRKDGLYTLAVRKDSWTYRRIAPLMDQAFDFSGFLRHPIGVEFPCDRANEFVRKEA